MNTNIFKVEREHETTGETWTEILMLDKIYSIREARFGESATRTGVRKGYYVYSIGGTQESAIWIDDETYKILVKKLENM